MAVTYTTAAKVASLLQVPAFSPSTKPTDGEVETFINWAEDEIDRTTHHAWRSVQITNEYHHYDGGLRRVVPGRIGYTGLTAYYPVGLRHRNVKSFVSGTDKIELLQGSSWLDLVATHVEGRDKDYWVDYELGKVYLLTEFPNVEGNSIRVAYKYGEAAVPKDVEMAATLLAAVNVLSSQDKTVLVAEGGQVAEDAPRKIARFREVAGRILERRTEYPLMDRME